MDTVDTYKGYSLMHMDLEDSDGFTKNWFEIQCEGKRVYMISRYSYSFVEDGVSINEKFRSVVDTELLV